MIKLTVTKMIQVDNYENGCDPDTTQDLGVIYTQTFKDFESAKRYLMCISRDTELSVFENRLEASCLENDNGMTPMTPQLNEWKKGSRTLWLADYFYYLTIVTEQPLSEMDLVNHFPELKQA